MLQQIDIFFFSLINHAINSILIDSISLNNWKEQVINISYTR